VERGLAAFDAEVLKVGKRRFAYDRLAAMLQRTGAGRERARGLLAARLRGQDRAVLFHVRQARRLLAGSVDEAKATISALPPAAGGCLSYEFLPVRPLKPLGLLILEK
jgi:hypothetical protein